MQASRKDIDLGPRPGKLKSTVYAPNRPDEAVTKAIAAARSAVRRETVDGDDESNSDDELIIPSSDEEPTAPALAASTNGQMSAAQALRPKVAASGEHGPSGVMVDLDSSDVE